MQSGAEQCGNGPSKDQDGNMPPQYGSVYGQPLASAHPTYGAPPPAYTPTALGAPTSIFMAASYNSSPFAQQGNQQMATTTVNVRVAPPMPITPLVLGSPVTVTAPPSYLAWSIFTFLCCFWPLGLAALIFSVKLGSARSEAEAISYSSTARFLNVAGTVAGPVLIVVIVGIVVAVRSVSNAGNDYIISNYNN